MSLFLAFKPIDANLSFLPLRSQKLQCDVTFAISLTPWIDTPLPTTTYRPDSLCHQLWLSMPILLTRTVDIVFVCVLALVLRLVVVAVWYSFQCLKGQDKNLMCWKYLELAAFIPTSSVSLWALVISHHWACVVYHWARHEQRIIK